MGFSKRKKVTGKFYNKSDSFKDKLLTVLLWPVRFFLYYFVLQIVLRLVFRFGHGARFNKNGFKLPKKPFLVLCNHASNWDGIYLNVYLKKFVYFIMHDEIYKYKLSRLLAYNVLGQIKRGQGKSDLKWIRQIRDTAEGGRCVGVFPEGDISYTGKTLSVDKSIVKLAKILKLPIVMVRIDGETFRWPRWSVKARKSPFYITVTDICDADYVKKSGNDELYNRILQGISYNDEELRKRGLINVRGSRQAEKLERLLFMCPDCKSYTTLKSSKNKFFCTACGYQTMFNSGTFTKLRGENLIDNIYDWDKFQRGNLDDIISDCKLSGMHIFVQTNVNCYLAEANGHFYRPSSRGTLVLADNRLSFIDKEGKQTDCAIADIRDVYIQFKGTLEFTFNEQRYRFRSVHDEHFGYLYKCFIERIQELGLSDGENLAAAGKQALNSGTQAQVQAQTQTQAQAQAPQTQTRTAAEGKDIAVGNDGSLVSA